MDELERFEAFAVTMFRSFLVGMECNKARQQWTREASDHAERTFVAALKDYRSSIAAQQLPE